MKWLEKYADDAYALMRIMTGFLFTFHGLQKILGVLAEMQPPGGVPALDWRDHRTPGRAGGDAGVSIACGGFPLQRHHGRGLYSVPLEVPDRT